MYIHNVVSADITGNLPNSLQKRLTFNIAYRAAYLSDNHIRISLIANIINLLLYFIGNMRNNLNCSSKIRALSFLCYHGMIDLAGSYIAVFSKALIDKSLIVPQIKVCFSAVVCDKHFSVLIWAHGSRVYVDVRIKFLYGNPKPSCL